MDNNWGSSLAHKLRGRQFKVNYAELGDRFFDGDYNANDLNIEGKPAYIIACRNPAQTSDRLHGKIIAAQQAMLDNNATRTYVFAPAELFGRAERGPKDYSGESKLKGKGNQVRALSKIFWAMDIDGYLVIDSHKEKVMKDIFAEQYGNRDVFFNIRQENFLHRYLTRFSMADFEQGKGDDIVFVIVDAGDKERVLPLYNIIKKWYPNISWAQMEKTKYADNARQDQMHIRFVEASDNFTGLEGKTGFFIDDIGETINTLKSNVNYLDSDNSFTKEYGKLAKKIAGLTHASFSMYYRDWNKNHKMALENLAACGFDELVLTNTLDYFSYALDVDREDHDLRKISEVVQKFSKKEFELFYDIQQNTTILDLSPSVIKAIHYLESFDGNLPNNFDINKVFYDPKWEVNIAPFMTNRSHHFIDFKRRPKNHSN